VAIIEKVQRAVAGPPKPDPEIEDRLTRGRARMKDGAPYRAECWAFFRGDQFAYVNSEKFLVRQNTVRNQDGSGKPDHRQRKVYNLVTPVIGHKVSGATSRVPAYETNASTQDPEDINAARLSGKVARFGYDAWSIRQATVDAVTHALVGDEGFAWPFFDNTIGPYVDDGEGGTVGVGEIRVRTFGASEVFWEPGLRFDESRWHAVEQARPIEDVRAEYDCGPLAADAQPSADSVSSSERTPTNTKLVLVTDYLERPSQKEQDGRWITIANGKVISTRNYPCEDHEGKVLDEPVLHKLSFISDPDSDRDMGLMRFLVDPQRAFSHAYNKQNEWVQLALSPQIVVKNGVLKQKLNDMPGMVYNFMGSGDATWRETPPIPPELEQLKASSKEILQFIAADQDIPQGVESARGIAAAFERDESVWAEFYSHLAEFHSRLMRHCLYLVQRFYTEPRLIKIKGRFGAETIADFQGADLRGQVDVTVLPGSITPRTRKEVEEKVSFFAAQGWISPQAALYAMNGGNAEDLINDVDLAVSRVSRIIQAIKAGPEILLNSPEVVVGIEPPTLPDPTGIIDPMTLTPVEIPNPKAGLPIKAPNWMPRYSDNTAIWKAKFDEWFQTEEYENLDEPMQEAAANVYVQIIQTENQKAAEAQMAETQAAMEQGMGNAAKPQGAKPRPDSPVPEGNTMATRNQPPDQALPPGQ
jgi:hypothetical protein